MNACIVLCLALTAFLANAVAQYETCVADTEIVTGGTPGVTVSIGRDEANEMVQITLVGPSDVWFGHGFDGLVMANNYGFIISDSGVSERRFAAGYDEPTELATTSIVGTPEITTGSSGDRTVVIERPYSATDAFDFTPILGTCEESTIEAIAAIGQDATFGAPHTDKAFGTLTSTCVCVTERPTTAMPTTLPTTARPTTSMPTVLPTPSPTGLPTTSTTAADSGSLTIRGFTAFCVAFAFALIFQ